MGKGKARPGVPTDADAQFMRTGDHGVAPGYNVQITTDAAHGIIIGVEASKNPSDADNLIPAMEQVKKDFGAYPEQAIGDGDYTNRKTILEAAGRGIDFYGSWGKTERKSGHGIDPAYEATVFRCDPQRNEFICPEGKRLRYLRSQDKSGAEKHVYAADRDECRACSARQKCSPNNAMPKRGRTISLTVEHPAVEQFNAKILTECGKAIYRVRSPIAEFPHAWLKTKLNFVRFRCRGVRKPPRKLSGFAWCTTCNATSPCGNRQSRDSSGPALARGMVRPRAVRAHPWSVL
jgi:hypothetical protein